MNPQTLTEAKKIFNSVKKGTKGVNNVELVICPPFVWLPYLFDKKNNSLNPQLGAQNCFWEEKGAFTGEISPLMLKNLGIKYVILGHSERRRYLAEDNKIINKKIKLALKLGMKPVFLVGENENEKMAGTTFEVIKNQINEGLAGISKKLIKNLLLAYEPVWAIGNGKFCQPSQAQTVNIFLKRLIAKNYGEKIAKNIPILYGGSVDSKNALSYLDEAGMIGILVGSASLEVQEFVKIVKIINKI
jgi:triosephosphate isomerase